MIKKDPHNWLQIKMRIKRGLIGALIGVHGISNVKWGYKDNFKLVYFFYEKNSRAQKAPQRRTSNCYPLKRLCAQKIVAFVVQCLLNFVFLVNVCLLVFLCARSLFVKNKKIIMRNRLKIVLITSFRYTTPCELMFNMFAYNENYNSFS